MLYARVTIQMTTSEKYFPVELFIMLCKVVLTFESRDEILKCECDMKNTFLCCC